MLPWPYLHLVKSFLLDLLCLNEATLHFIFPLSSSSFYRFLLEDFLDNAQFTEWLPVNWLSSPLSGAGLDCVLAAYKPSIFSRNTCKNQVLYLLLSSSVMMYNVNLALTHILSGVTRGLVDVNRLSRSFPDHSYRKTALKIYNKYSPAHFSYYLFSSSVRYFTNIKFSVATLTLELPFLNVMGHCASKCSYPGNDLIFLFWVLL